MHGFFEKHVIGFNLHADSQSQPANGLPDAAKAYDAKCLAAQFAALRILLFELFEFIVPLGRHSSVGILKKAGPRVHMCHHQFGYGLGRSPRSVKHFNAFLLGIGKVNIVKPYSATPDEFKFARSIHHFRSNLRGTPHQQGIK